MLILCSLIGLLNNFVMFRRVCLLCRGCHGWVRRCVNQILSCTQMEVGRCGLRKSEGWGKRKSNGKWSQGGIHSRAIRVLNRLEAWIMITPDSLRRSIDHNNPQFVGKCHPHGVHGPCDSCIPTAGGGPSTDLRVCQVAPPPETARGESSWAGKLRYNSLGYHYSAPPPRGIVMWNL